MSTTVNRISVSQVGTYISCPLSWHYKYQMGLRQKDKPDSWEAPSLGSAVHYVVSKVLMGGDIGESIHQWTQENKPKFHHYELEESFEKWDQMLLTAEAVSRNLFENHLDMERFRVYKGLVEHHFEYLDPRGVLVNGFVDAVLEDTETGLIQVYDWKIRQSFQSLDDLILDTQIPVYIYCMRKEYPEISSLGVQFQVRNKGLTLPSLNKNGSMSRASIFTTWQVYCQALLENGLNPDDYLDMKDKLWHNSFTERTEIPFSDIALTNIYENFVGVGLEMRDRPSSYGCNNWLCRNCSFKPICISESRGYDTEALIGEMYVSARKD